MNKRLNQAILIIAIIIVLMWNYCRYTNKNKLKIEKYEMDKSQIMEHLNTSTEIDSLLTMSAAAKLTDDDQTIQSAYDLAESQNREELVKLFESL
jgi:hypothetical protein